MTRDTFSSNQKTYLSLGGITRLFVALFFVVSLASRVSRDPRSFVIACMVPPGSSSLWHQLSHLYRKQRLII